MSLFQANGHVPNEKDEGDEAQPMYRGHQPHVHEEVPVNLLESDADNRFQVVLRSPINYRKLFSKSLLVLPS